MRKIVKAIYENGVFKPVEPVDASEGTEVEVSLPKPEEWNVPTPEEVYEAIQAIAALPRDPGIEQDPNVSRDHDKYLYGSTE